MLDDEQRKVARILPNVPVTLISVGPRRGLDRAPQASRDAAQDQAHAHQARGARGVEPAQLARQNGAADPQGHRPDEGAAAARQDALTRRSRTRHPSIGGCRVRVSGADCAMRAGARAGSGRIRTVPATLSWNPRWSESQTSAGTTRHSRTVRTTGRQSPTQPPASGTTRMPVSRCPTLPPIVGMKTTCMIAKIASVSQECSTELYGAKSSAMRIAARPVDGERAEAATRRGRRIRARRRGARAARPASGSVRARRRSGVSRQASVESTDRDCA